jgi:hypothetical protein
MDWQAASAVVGMILALVTVGVLLVNVQQVKASRAQVRASEDQASAMREQVRVDQQQITVAREQFRQSQQQQQESLEASQRPYLYPFGELDVVRAQPSGNLAFDFDRLDPGQAVQIKNSGAGIAFNVRGALLQARPPGRTPPALAPRLRSITLGDPLPVGADETVQSYAGPFLFGWDSAVSNDLSDTLVAPEDAIVRLTLTYQDIFGYTHASQFDYIDRGVSGPRWQFHRFLPKVLHDLEALAEQQGLATGRQHAEFLARRAEDRRAGGGSS